MNAQMLLSRTKTCGDRIWELGFVNSYAIHRFPRTVACTFESARCGEIVTSLDGVCNDVAADASNVNDFGSVSWWYFLRPNAQNALERGPARPLAGSQASDIVGTAGTDAVQAWLGIRCAQKAS